MGPATQLERINPAVDWKTAGLFCARMGRYTSWEQHDATRSERTK